jgi:hypothetical protein
MESRAPVIEFQPRPVAAPKITHQSTSRPKSFGSISKMEQIALAEEKDTKSVLAHVTAMNPPPSFSR